MRETDLTPVPNPPESPSVTPPGGLTSDALDLWHDVLEENGNTITAVGFGALVQAVKLVSLADRAEEAIGDQWIVPGYRGQLVANPLVGEARMARSAAVTALRSVGLHLAEPSAASNAGRALVGQRWRRNG
ncbi:hypothetical protein [Micromonospora sp. NPDC005305]|uniref:hypothetical protein n=1 Tax=Micromonospora sp. NPDC005305 TaxID=3156875 RepID=UPI0033A83066